MNIVLGAGGAALLRGTPGFSQYRAKSLLAALFPSRPSWAPEKAVTPAQLRCPARTEPSGLVTLHDCG